MREVASWPWAGKSVMTPINVLISLHKGYGLGDAVQMSAVLRHVTKYRPHWLVDFQADRGQHIVGRGLTNNQFCFGEQYPSPHYEAEVQILLYDTWANWGDRPNTRVSSCLHERFGLPWDAECARYHINLSQEVAGEAAQLVLPRSVALHYRGDSSPDKKNLSHEQAARIYNKIVHLGRTPLLLDWRNEWPIDGQRVIGERGRWADMNCAIISRCEAFVGIDSGPSKCASATETPALVVWTGHHPAPFHDPAPNTTHLVPRGYHGLEPVCGDRGVIEWFERNYAMRYYDRDLVAEVGKWLEEILA